MNKNYINNENDITLFVMTEKGYEFLKSTISYYKKLFKLVVVGSDKNIKNDFEEEIIQLCVSNNIPFEKKSNFKKINTKYAMAISWRWLIDHPPQQLIIFHDSILPKYRGFSPLVNSLINGETEIGVSAIFGAQDFDTGDIIMQAKSHITYPIKIFEAIKINNENYLKCALHILNKLANNDVLTAKKQKNQCASYSVWRDENDYRIDWNYPSDKIQRFIHALSDPYQGAFCFMGNSKIRIIDAEVFPDIKIENRDVGKVLLKDKEKAVVICGKGLLKITEAYIEDVNHLKPFFPIPKFRIRLR